MAKMETPAVWVNETAGAGKVVLGKHLRPTPNLTAPQLTGWQVTPRLEVQPIWREVAHG